MLGQAKLGQALITHAKHEAGHHLMTLADCLERSRESLGALGAAA